MHSIDFTFIDDKLGQETMQRAKVVNLESLLSYTLICSPVVIY